MARRKTALSDLSVLLFWLLIVYLAYKSDPRATEAMKGVVGGVERVLRFVFR